MQFLPDEYKSSEAPPSPQRLCVLLSIVLLMRVATLAVYAVLTSLHHGFLSLPLCFLITYHF